MLLRSVTNAEANTIVIPRNYQAYAPNVLIFCMAMKIAHIISKMADA